MLWKTIGRPGQTGFKKNQITAELNSRYGVGNWRRMWLYDGRELLQQDAFLVCEEAYLADARNRPEVWQRLILEARDIYDMLSEEVESGRDYTKQHKFTRFHDICIRRVVQRLGLRFNGNELIQIRFNENNSSWASQNFDPGKVKFHEPQKITTPLLEGYWDPNSIECFYQSNKVLQVKG